MVSLVKNIHKSYVALGNQIAIWVYETDCNVWYIQQFCGFWIMIDCLCRIEDIIAMVNDEMTVPPPSSPSKVLR